MVHFKNERGGADKDIVQERRKGKKLEHKQRDRRHADDTLFFLH